MFLKIPLVVVIVVALALLFAQDQETFHIKSGVAAEDPVFPDYVAALTGSGITRGDEYRILANGVEIFPAMLDAIRQARRRINFETYIYDSGKVAEEFTTALADAAARGVEVRLIVDAVGASAMEREHVERLQRAGVADRHVQPRAVVLHRGDQLPHAPQDSRHRRRRGIHRRCWCGRSLAR